jgi:DUF177 domain-containing protein
MHIEIESLTEAGRPFTHTYGPAELSLEDERARLVGATEVAGRASRKRQRVHLRGTIATELEVYCDRCLAPVGVPLNTEFDVRYDPPDADDASENVELQGEELEASIYTGEQIDLDELVREQVLLALPTRSLCREDCKGLCPTCGADLNAQDCNCEQREIDPRWAGLAALKKDSES